MEKLDAVHEAAGGKREELSPFVVAKSGGHDRARVTNDQAAGVLVLALDTAPPAVTAGVVVGVPSAVAG